MKRKLIMMRKQNITDQQYRHVDNAKIKDTDI